MRRAARTLVTRQLTFRFARTETALALLGPSKRRLALLRERDLLVARVQRKEQLRDKVDAAVQAASLALSQQLTPLLAEVRELGQRVHFGFHALLSSKLTNASRRAVREVYQALTYTGILPPYEEPELPDEDEEFDAPGARAASESAGWEDTWQDEDAARRERASQEHAQRREARAKEGGDGSDSRGDSQNASGRAGASEPPPPGPEEEHPSPAREAAPSSALKSLFRELAATLHPDRVQRADDKARRTEAMKQLTRAYAQGNLAAMLAVKQRWEEATPAPTKSAEEESLAELEHTVKQLRNQLREVERELRSLRRESPLADVGGFSHKPGEDPGAAIAELVAGVARERDTLLEVEEFVAAFGAGQLPLADFRLGPPCLRARRIAANRRRAAAPAVRRPTRPR